MFVPSVSVWAWGEPEEDNVLPMQAAAVLISAFLHW